MINKVHIKLKIYPYKYTIVNLYIDNLKQYIIQYYT